MHYAKTNGIRIHKLIYYAFIADIVIKQDYFEDLNLDPIFEKYKYTGMWRSPNVECNFKNGLLDGKFYCKTNTWSTPGCTISDAMCFMTIKCNYINGKIHGEHILRDNIISIYSKTKVEKSYYEYGKLKYTIKC